MTKKKLKKIIKFLIIKKLFLIQSNLRGKVTVAKNLIKIKKIMITYFQKIYLNLRQTLKFLGLWTKKNKNKI